MYFHDNLVICARWFWVMLISAMSISKSAVQNDLYQYLIGHTAEVPAQRQASFTRECRAVRIIWSDIIITGLNIFDADKFETIHGFLVLVYLVETLIKMRSFAEWLREIDGNNLRVCISTITL